MLALKRMFCVVISFVIGFFTYPLSFLPSNNDNVFNVETGEFSADSAFLNGVSAETSNSGYSSFDNGYVSFENELTVSFDSGFCDWFNYYAISYCSDSYIKGIINYRSGVKAKSEEFFLEPSETPGSFYSFIDGFLEGVKANCIESVTFVPLDKEKASFSLKGIATFNRSIPENEIFVENGSCKIGVNLLWGGALSYFEDLDSNVQAVEVDGIIKVDSNASERYGVQSVNNNVNLINRNDTGRLIQQSYYGTGDSSVYDCGVFMGNVWNYNPVQGGNQYNESSKIVDYRIDETSIYIKCRPLDWAKSKEFITPSYMEATYTISGEKLHAECRFVDFSGYPDTFTSQELPAFYCVEPLNRYVYYGGNEPWSGGALTVVPDLIFWPDAGYPHFNSTESWSAFIGDFDDSFGMGVYVPGETDFLSGVYERGKTANSDPSKDGPTSYIALIKFITFKSFSPFEYEYYISTGTAEQIRNSFSQIK